MKAKKHAFAFHIFLLSALLLLQGCATGRQFNSDVDTGYELQGEKKEVGVDPGPIALKSAFKGSFTAGLLLGLTGPLALVLAPVSGYAAARWSANSFMKNCAEKHCFGHRPQNDILLSGNVMRGEIYSDYLKKGEITHRFSKGKDKNALTIYDNPDYNENLQHFLKEMYPYRVFKKPEGLTPIFFPANEMSWDALIPHVLYDNKKMDLYPGDLVDVYFPHMPEAERKAIVKGKLYDAFVVHIVCKRDDEECLDKYERDDDNFILGRWKTLDAYLSDYKNNDGFPNPDDIRPPSFTAPTSI